MQKCLNLDGLLNWLNGSFGQEDIDMINEIISKIKKLDRWYLEWEWMSKHEDGDYLDYKEVMEILEEFKND